MDLENNSSLFDHTKVAICTFNMWKEGDALIKSESKGCKAGIPHTDPLCLLVDFKSCLALKYLKLCV